MSTNGKRGKKTSEEQSPTETGSTEETTEFKEEVTLEENILEAEEYTLRGGHLNIWWGTRPGQKKAETPEEKARANKGGYCIDEKLPFRFSIGEGTSKIMNVRFETLLALYKWIEGNKKEMGELLKDERRKTVSDETF